MDIGSQILVKKWKKYAVNCCNLWRIIIVAFYN